MTKLEGKRKKHGNQKLLMPPRTNQKAFYKFISPERSNAYSLV